MRMHNWGDWIYSLIIKPNTFPGTVAACVVNRRVLWRVLQQLPPLGSIENYANLIGQLNDILTGARHSSSRTLPLLQSDHIPTYVSPIIMLELFPDYAVSRLVHPCPLSFFFYRNFSFFLCMPLGYSRFLHSPHRTPLFLLFCIFMCFPRSVWLSLSISYPYSS